MYMCPWSHLEGLVADKVLLVVVIPKLSQTGIQLVHIKFGVDFLGEDALHLIEVCKGKRRKARDGREG